MTTKDVTTKDITTKAMLVSLNIKAWTANKKDKLASAKLAEEFNSDAKWTRGNKSLASKTALSEITSIISSARTFHLFQTLPWTDEGYRILPSTNYLFYTTEMRKFNNQFENAVSTITANYTEMKNEAKLMLGQLYNELDYPSATEIAGKYSLNVSVSPIPSANDFRVTQITEEDINAIQKQIADRLEESKRTIIKDSWERLHEVVNKAFEAFNDPDIKFHDSKIENIAEMVDVLSRLNVFDDPKLTRMCKVIEERLCNLDPKEVRTNADERKDAAQDAKGILDTIAGYL